MVFNARLPARRKKLLTFGIALALVSAIFVPFQRVEAFTVDIDMDDAITQSATGQAFDIVVDVQAGELISVEEITLILDNDESSVKVTTFDSDGLRVAGSTTLVKDNLVDIEFSSSTSNGYGYGFGYVSNGYTYVAPYQYVFNYVEDYVGGNTLGYTSSGTTDYVSGLLGPGNITISGILRTADLADGPHTLEVLIDTGANGNGEDQLTAPAFEFTVDEDDSIVFEETPVDSGATTATIATEDSDGDPINVVLNFGSATTAAGNIVVTVQNVDDFIAANTEAELEEQGFELDGDELIFTTNDDDFRFIAVGFIMDIDISALGLPEGTEVTLEMEYDDTGLSSSEENRVRLMHQLDTLDEWEALTNDDETINDGDEVDTENDIVYGTTDDFSLFGPAVRESVSSGGSGGGSGGGGGGGGGSRVVVVNQPPTTEEPVPQEDDTIQWETFRLTVDGKSYNIQYNITNGTVEDMTLDKDNRKLVVSITSTTTDDGNLKLRLPREVIDSRSGADGRSGADQPFAVFFEDGTEATPDEQTPTSTMRQLSIDFPAGTQEVQILGTFAVPEFGSIAVIIMGLAIVGIILATARYTNNSRFNFRGL